MNDGYSVWDDLAADTLVVDEVGDLGPIVALEEGARVYERDTGQLLEWKGGKGGWEVVRETPQQVVTPGDGVFGIRRRSIWRTQ